jgi:hypothetical protein
MLMLERTDELDRLVVELAREVARVPATPAEASAGPG